MPRDNISFNRTKNNNVMKERKEIINFLAEKGKVSDSVKKNFSLFTSRFLFGQTIKKRDYNILLDIAIFGEKNGEINLNDKKLNILKYFDSDNNGTFSKKEVEQIKKYLDFAEQEGFSTDEIFANLQDMDKNKDGILDKTEPISFNNPNTNKKINNDYNSSYDNNGNLTLQKNNSLAITEKKELPKADIKKFEQPKAEIKKEENKTAKTPMVEIKKIELPKAVIKNTELPKTEIKKEENKTAKTPMVEIKKSEQPKAEIKKPVDLSRTGNENIRQIKEILNDINDKDTLAEFMKNKDLFQYTPLRNAIFHNNSEMVEILLNKVETYPDLLKEVLLEEELFKNTPLHDAIKKNNVEITDTILRNISKNKPLFEEIMLKNASGIDETPFFCAVLFNNPEIIKCMLKYIDSKELFEKLILNDYASEKNSQSYAKGEIKTLLEDAAKKYGVDLQKNMKERVLKEKNLIENISLQNKTPDEVKVILENIKDEKQIEKILLKKDENGNTIFHKADEDMAEAILSSIKNDKLLKKVLLNENSSWQTPLDTIKSDVLRLVINKIKNNTDLAKEILLKKDRYGYTLLHRNVNNYDKASALLKSIEDNKELLTAVLEARDFTGWSAYRVCLKHITSYGENPSGKQVPQSRKLLRELIERLAINNCIPINDIF